MSRTAFTSSCIEDEILLLYNNIMRIMPRGKDAYHWKGGTKNNNGYIMVQAPSHPNCDSQGYVREHRLVMEKHLGRYLEKDEVIHHINHKKNDNRVENLIILTKKEHDNIHLSSPGIYRYPKGNTPWNKGRVGVMPRPWNKGLVHNVALSCITCHELFSVIPSRKNKAKYCSRKCQPIWNKGIKGLQPWHNLKGLRYVK